MCDSAKHYIAGLKHLLRYIKLSRLTKIIYKPNNSTGKAIDSRDRLYSFTHRAFLKRDIKLREYTNAAYANDKQDRKFSYGYVFLLAGGPVAWVSRK